MAIHAHSTTAPALQPRLLRPFTFRPAPPVHDPRRADELLEEIRRTIAGQQSVVSLNDTHDLPPEPLLPPALPSLTSAFSRRRAIFGAVALAAAPAVALPAGAQPKPSTSPEAAALRAEFERLCADHQKAGSEVDEAYDAVEYPEAPEDLFWLSGDAARLGLRQPTKSWVDGRPWYGDPEKVEDLRSAPFRFFSGHPDTKGAARRDEIVGAWDRWQAATQQAEDVAGYTAASDRFEAVNQAYIAFRMRLVELRTSDPDIMALKARVVLDLLQGDLPLLDHRIEATLREDCGPWGPALSLSLTRDFIGLLGAAYV